MTTPHTRPPGVFAAAYLFSGTSALWLTAGIATLFAIPQYSRHYGDLKQDADAASIAGLLLVLIAIVAATGAALTLLLALLDAHGRGGARVFTYLVSVVAIGVAISILVLDVFAAIPWHRWLMSATAVLTLLFVLATGVLLALPSSAAYFRFTREERKAERTRAWLARQAAAQRRPPYPPPGYRPQPPGGP